MSEHLHFVKITGTSDDPRIEFTCHGTRDSKCHSYPDCKCEYWEPGHEHPFVPHDECWMAHWFANAVEGAIDPMPEYLADCEISVGDSGPISAWFCHDYIEWEFLTPEATS